MSDGNNNNLLRVSSRRAPLRCNETFSEGIACLVSGLSVLVFNVSDVPNKNFSGYYNAVGGSTVVITRYWHGMEEKRGDRV